MFVRYVIAALCLTAVYAISNDSSNNQTDTEPAAPLPSMNAPSSAEQWLVRGKTTFQLVNNHSVVKEWPIESVNHQLKSQQSQEQYDHQQAALDRWTDRLANQFKYDPSQQSSNQSISLIDWYLGHAQCRGCVAKNHQLIDPSINEFDQSVDLPAHAPRRVMKWCSKTYTRRGRQLIDNDQTIIETPEETGRPLMDYEGYCIESINQCPEDAVDLNILDQSTCHGDDAATKLTCPLCVLDGHVWRTRRSTSQIDGYDGECWSRDVLAFTDFRNDPDQLFIDELTQCAPGFGVEAEKQ